MNSARVFYTDAAENADSIEYTGLQPTPHATTIDLFLDEQRPKSIPVSRAESIRGRLLYNDRLLDAKTGKLIEPTMYKLSPKTVAFSIQVDPDLAYVSDCDAYNQVVEAFERHAPQDALNSLARAYWRRLLPMPEVLKHYGEDEGSLVIKNKPDEDAAFPCHLSDVEVLIAGSVDATQIRRIL